METLKIEYVEAGKLNPAPYNPRVIDEENLKRLSKLLDTNGFVGPVIARREDNLLIGGHQRLKANQLRTIPDEKIPCVFLDGLSDDECKALNISLNNPQAQGLFDTPKLAELLDTLDDADFDVPDMTGYTKEDIAEIMAGYAATGQDWEDAMEAIPDGERPGFQQITFTLTDDQTETVKGALAKAKVGGFNGTGNENSNGNALTKIVEAYDG